MSTGSTTGELGGQFAGRTRFFLLVALVLVFAALYPYLSATGSCGEPGCPHFSHGPAPVELPAGTLVAALVALPAAAIAHRIRHRLDPERKPAQVCLSPDPDPPRP
ncbi:MAG TPA: hypothetical protein VK869_06235 [Rubrobacteraceae bacterium]|nr:hypothetical protein [Rubrobacteraceae bacterium]